MFSICLPIPVLFKGQHRNIGDKPSPVVEVRQSEARSTARANDSHESPDPDVYGNSPRTEAITPSHKTKRVTLRDLNRDTLIQKQKLHFYRTTGR